MSSITRLDELPQIPRPIRFVMLAGMHLGFFTAAYLSAFLIRFDFQIPAGHVVAMWHGLAGLLVVKMVIFGALKMFQGWWKYVSLHDVIALAQALAIGSVAFMLVNTFVIAPESFPRSIYLLDFVLALLFISGARGSLRIVREAAVNRPRSSQRTVNLIIAGAGDTGETLLREITKNRNLHYKPVAFLDDDSYKRGLRIHGVPVLGPISSMPQVVEKYGVEQVIIAMPSANREQLREVVDLARSLDVETKILPAVESILMGHVSLNQLREVSISDLLGREPVKLDTESIGRFLEGRRVLITGAGGSIGSELCRQALRFNPAELIMVERAETPLFFIHRELVGAHQGRLSPYVANVSDRDRMEVIFEAHRPDVIIHAAAYKHVPLMEQNPCEAVKNNVLGTQTMADLAAAYAADTFVLISTDKAVNPTSIMGATKRVTELYVQKLNAEHPETKFCAVRFGNVLGSNGSVVPIFREQIKRGGPVTVTHPEMTRYFMTIPEAVQLVLQAAAFKSHGELFILDMGDPVKIADLARDMIRLSGASEQDVAVTFTGMRPGEKLFEELTLDEENVDRTGHQKIFVGRNKANEFDEIGAAYFDLIEAAYEGRELEVRRLLKAIIPTYSHPDILENVVLLDTHKTRAIKKA